MFLMHSVVLFQYITEEVCCSAGDDSLGYEFVIVACTLSLGIGGYNFAISISKEIQRILLTINNEAHADSRLNEIKNILSEYIHVTAAIKKLSISISFEKVAQMRSKCITALTTVHNFNTIKV